MLDNDVELWKNLEEYERIKLKWKVKEGINKPIEYKEWSEI